MQKPIRSSSTTHSIFVNPGKDRVFSEFFRNLTVHDWHIPRWRDPRSAVRIIASVIAVILWVRGAAFSLRSA
jgi:hypothetical protein